MSVFKENLTSKLLQEHSIKIINKKKNILKILELGCGDGNISKFLIKHQKKKNLFFASDISRKAVSLAKKNCGTKINFKCGDFFDPWKKEKFNIIISDISSINDQVANLSPWYRNIVCNSGTDGLKNIRKIIKNIEKYLEKNSFFIIPVISLSNTNQLNILLKKKFKKVLLTKKVSWPLPSFFSKNIEKFEILKKKKHIEFEEKFGMCIAYTRVAICKL